MREQTVKMKELLSEYKDLRKKIFGKEKFAKVENNPDQRRYEQLLAFFHPQFRRRNWRNPLYD